MTKASMLFELRANPLCPREEGVRFINIDVATDYMKVNGHMPITEGVDT